jgi:hypothetical protein
MGLTGYYAHECPSADSGCLTGQQFARRAQNDQSVGTGENIQEGGYPNNTWSDAEAGFMAESAKCATQPATYANCPYVGAPPNETGHFLNVINPSYVFAGVAEYDNGKASFSPPSPVSYFVEEFQ